MDLTIHPKNNYFCFNISLFIIRIYKVLDTYIEIMYISVTLVAKQLTEDLTDDAISLVI